MWGMRSGSPLPGKQYESGGARLPGVAPGGSLAREHGAGARRPLHGPPAPDRGRRPRSRRRSIGIGDDRSADVRADRAAAEPSLAISPVGAAGNGVTGSSTPTGNDLDPLPSRIKVRARPGGVSPADAVSTEVVSGQEMGPRARRHRTQLKPPFEFVGRTPAPGGSECRES